MTRALVMLPTLSLLAACASPVALTGPEGAMAAGTPTMSWLEPHAMEVRLEGKRYVGEWRSSACFTDACRGTYRDVPRIHRRHIRQGQAILTAADGARLECRWVSHLPEVDGNCTSQDGRIFKLWASQASTAL
jgi:hypothetical protein